MAPGGSTARRTPLADIPTAVAALYSLRLARDYCYLRLTPTLQLAISLHFADCHAVQRNLLSFSLSRRRLSSSLAVCEAEY